MDIGRNIGAQLQADPAEAGPRLPHRRPFRAAGSVVPHDANNANAVKAAEPIANPLPRAAVVLPTASSLSVIFLTS